MQVIRSLDACPRPPEGTAITLGFFDGVHLGHQLLIGEARRLAAEQRARSAVVTFDQHPAAVVRPSSAPRLLTSLDHRLELLAATGVDHVVVVPFDEARSKESPEDFVEGVLVDCLRTRAVVVGADFHFGHQRRGDVALLTEMGRTRGFEVEGVQLLGSGSQGARPVSSTAIRAALAEGDLPAANRMLGRPHEVRGSVPPQGGGGAHLVVLPPGVALPADGVYAAWCEGAGGAPSAATVRVGPPAEDGSAGAGGGPVVEVELVETGAAVEAGPVKLRFVHRLRGLDEDGSGAAPADLVASDRDLARAMLR